MPSTSSASSAPQYTDFDFDQQSYPFSPVHPLGEEAEVSDEEFVNLPHTQKWYDVCSIRKTFPGSRSTTGTMNWPKCFHQNCSTWPGYQGNNSTGHFKKMGKVSQRLNHGLSVLKVIAKAEDEIGHHDDKYYTGSSCKKSDWFHPYNPPAKNAPDTVWRSDPPAGKQPSHRGQSNWGQGSGQGLQLFTVTSQESQFL